MLKRARDFLAGKKVYNILFPLYFVFSSFRVIDNLQILSNITPLISVLLILLLYPLVKENSQLKKILLLVNLFGIWACITAIWSLYHIVSASRAVMFLVTANALILGAYQFVKLNKGKPLSFLLPLNLILLAFGLYSLITHIPADYWEGYGYGLKSFFGHQNMYGSLLVFSLSGIISILEKHSTKKNSYSLLNYLIMQNRFMSLHVLLRWR